MNQSHQNRIGVRVANGVLVVPVTPRVDVDDLADLARADNFNHTDVVLRKPEHMARQNKAGGAPLIRKEANRGVGGRRNRLLHQDTETSAERSRTNLDMQVNWGGDDDGVSFHAVYQS